MWPFRAKSDGKQVARWLNDMMLRPPSSRSVEDGLFLCFLGNLLSFAVEEEHIGCEPEPDGGLVRKVNERNMDSALLELACFRYVDFDFYLYAQHPGLRDRQSTLLERKIKSLFGGVLGRRYVDVTFFRRVTEYGRLRREASVRPDSVEHLAAILALARGNSRVREYSFEEGPHAAVAGFYEYMESLAHAHAWYVAMTPTFLEIVEELIPSLAE